MKILNVAGQTLHLTGCVSFKFRGYIISGSTVFQPYFLFAIMLDNESMDFVETELTSVEDCINWCLANPL